MPYSGARKNIADQEEIKNESVNQQAFRKVYYHIDGVKVNLNI